MKILFSKLDKKLEYPLNSNRYMRELKACEILHRDVSNMPSANFWLTSPVGAPKASYRSRLRVKAQFKHFAKHLLSPNAVSRDAKRILDEFHEIIGAEYPPEDGFSSVKRSSPDVSFQVEANPFAPWEVSIILTDENDLGSDFEKSEFSKKEALEGLIPFVVPACFAEAVFSMSAMKENFERIAKRNPEKFEQFRSPEKVSTKMTFEEFLSVLNLYLEYGDPQNANTESSEEVWTKGSAIFLTYLLWSLRSFSTSIATSEHLREITRISRNLFEKWSSYLKDTMLKGAVSESSADSGPDASGGKGGLSDDERFRVLANGLYFVLLNSRLQFTLLADNIERIDSLVKGLFPVLEHREALEAVAKEALLYWSTLLIKPNLSSKTFRSWYSEFTDKMMSIVRRKIEAGEFRPDVKEDLKKVLSFFEPHGDDNEEAVEFYRTMSELLFGASFFQLVFLSDADNPNSMFYGIDRVFASLHNTLRYHVPEHYEKIATRLTERGYVDEKWLASVKKVLSDYKDFCSPQNIGSNRSKKVIKSIGGKKNLREIMKDFLAVLMDESQWAAINKSGVRHLDYYRARTVQTDRTGRVNKKERRVFFNEKFWEDGYFVKYLSEFEENLAGSSSADFNEVLGLLQEGDLPSDFDFGRASEDFVRGFVLIPYSGPGQLPLIFNLIEEIAFGESTITSRLTSLSALFLQTSYLRERYVPLKTFALATYVERILNDLEQIAVERTGTNKETTNEDVQRFVSLKKEMSEDIGKLKALYSELTKTMDNSTSFEIDFREKGFLVSGLGREVSLLDVVSSFLEKNFVLRHFLIHNPHHISEKIANKNSRTLHSGYITGCEKVSDLESKVLKSKVGGFYEKLRRSKKSAEARSGFGALRTIEQSSGRPKVSFASMTFKDFLNFVERTDKVYEVSESMVEYVNNPPFIEISRSENVSDVSPYLAEVTGGELKEVLGHEIPDKVFALLGVKGVEKYAVERAMKKLGLLQEQSVELERNASENRTDVGLNEDELFEESRATEDSAVEMEVSL